MTLMIGTSGMIRLITLALQGFLVFQSASCAYEKVMIRSRGYKPLGELQNGLNVLNDA
uniref:Uncharacterized protein n=1 Tax=Phakopsora pachyrhizi TaxID=170000 RepID=A0A0S1MIV2_PHAPC